MEAIKKLCFKYNIKILFLLLIFFMSACARNHENEVIEETESVSLDIIEYEGEWQRTDVPSYRHASIEITNWKDNESFDVKLYFTYSQYSGIIQGTATFIDESTAVLYSEDISILENKEDEDLGVYFSFTTDGIVISHSVRVRMAFGGGVCTAEGLYVKDEPKYTNCTDVSELFTGEELKSIQALLQDRYDDLFVSVIENGEVEVYEMEECHIWKAYWPPYKIAWCNVVIYYDGSTYIEGLSYGNESVEFYTNTSDEKMPDLKDSIILE